MVQKPAYCSILQTCKFAGFCNQPSEKAFCNVSASTSWSSAVKLAYNSHSSNITLPSVDLQVEILQLSNHLVSSLSLLSSKMEDDSLPTPSNLLSVLAALYPHLLQVSPGEGVLLSPFTDPDHSDQPQPCWLNRIGGPAPPTFPKFLTLEQSLTAYSSSAPLQMFLKPLPLGPSACVHLNPGLLPPPLVNSPHPP